MSLTRLVNLTLGIPDVDSVREVAFWTSLQAVSAYIKHKMMEPVSFSAISSRH